jgi:hypothetical protein
LEGAGTYDQVRTVGDLGKIGEDVISQCAEDNDLWNT